MTAGATRCISASDWCAATCESALAGDPSYTSPGTERYSEAHLALVSCASVCTLVSRALRAGDGDLDLLNWCAEVCTQCADSVPPAGVEPRAWAAVVQACGCCAEACRAMVDLIARSLRNAMGAMRDTDFQSTLEG